MNSLLLIVFMSLFQVYSITYCNDGQTCSQTNINDDIVNCWGFLGCKGSQITGTTRVWISGEGAVQSSNISAPQIDIVGYYASSNSIFDSKQLLEMELTFKGTLSGLGAQVHCRAGASCIINCELNGCLGLTVYYYDNINQIVMHPEICIQSPGSNSGCVACPKIETLSVSSTTALPTTASPTTASPSAFPCGSVIVISCIGLCILYVLCDHTSKKIDQNKEGAKIDQNKEGAKIDQNKEGAKIESNNNSKNIAPIEIVYI